MSYFWISKAIVIDVSGPHAMRYLNARLSNDIARLPVEESCLAAALTPQGKTEGLFAVYRISESRAILQCDGGDASAVVGAFRRYIVADRVEVRDVSSDWNVRHVTVDSNSSLSKFPRQISDSLIIASRKRASLEGVDLLSRSPHASFCEALLLEEPEISSLEATLLRFQAKIPSFPEELNDKHLFLESGMLEAISSTKGCYTGQEVVERILSQGKVPRVLKVGRFSGGADLKEGDKVTSQSGVAIGEILSSVHDFKNQITYAWLSLKNDPASFSQALLVKGASGVIDS